MSLVEFSTAISNYHSNHLVSFILQTVPFPMANAVVEVNSHSDAACVCVFVHYFRWTILLMSVGEIYLTEGKLVLCVYVRTICIMHQNCLLPSSKEVKSMRCRRLCLCNLKTRVVVSTWVFFKGLCFTSNRSSKDGDGDVIPSSNILLLMQISDGIFVLMFPCF